MAKLDELKEILTTMRLWLSLLFGSIFLVGSGVVNRIDKNQVDVLFWIGLGLIFLFGLIIIFLSVKISKITKQIKELKK
ncbi:MAG: hypothetical protein KN64_12140 [Sulfurovum sp. AS07-7]|nr:MAG: hypothetical protein KN64_12140 [Sulfurovum sp. AS07-7]